MLLFYPLDVGGGDYLVPALIQKEGRKGRCFGTRMVGCIQDLLSFDDQETPSLIVSGIRTGGGGWSCSFL